MVNGLGLRRQVGSGGLGRMGGFSLGPGGYCVCPSCGYRVKHEIGRPCYNRRCPKCGAYMTRERF